MRRNATNLPGEIALIFYPQLLKYFEMPDTVIAVTGTNGKTTVSNLIGEILGKNGFDLISNSFGGNVDTGIASILLDNCTLSGKFKNNTALFEMDERSAPRVLPYLRPDWLVCTNLQRDSMKRNAHPEFIFRILNENMPENKAYPQWRRPYKRTPCTGKQKELFRHIKAEIRNADRG